MIDSTFIWINETLHLEYNKYTWDCFRSTFIKAVIEGDTLVVVDNGGYRISNMGAKSQQMTWWGIEAIMNRVLPSEADAMADARTQIGKANMHMLSFNALCNLLFKKLSGDPVVIKALKAHAAAEHGERVRNIAEVQATVQHIIQMRADQDYSLDVQFIIPNTHPHQLYYIVGSEMRFIEDVRRYVKENNEVIIGTVKTC